MRVLITSFAMDSHFNGVVPLAWALRTAGHEVRVASQPALTGSITRAGLTAAPVGGDHRVEEVMGVAAGGVFALHQNPDYLEGRPELLSPDFLRASTAMLTATFYSQINNDSRVAGLVDFASWWRPDLVIWEPFTFAGAVAARVTGAAHARLLWGPDLFLGVRERFDDVTAASAPDQRDDAFAEWLTWTLARFGAELSPDVVTGHWTIDQMPASVRFKLEQQVVPMRYVPYNGPLPAVLPDWVREDPGRPRICVTQGVTGRLSGFAGLPSVDDLLEGVADLDAQVVVTLDPAERAAVRRVPDNVLLIDGVALHVVLPTCAAVVHHGGAGTWATAALYGVPQLILAWQWDDVFRARRLHHLGAGIYRAPGPDAGVDGIRAAIRTLLQEPAYRDRAGALRQEMLDSATPNDVVPLLEELTGAQRGQDMTYSADSLALMRQTADTQDHIEIEGARENNLKDVSVRIPKRKIVLFTGVSGSGKSSLVFDTVAAESQRQLNETFTNFVRNRLPKYGQPDVDSITNLSTAIVVDQKRLGGNARSTVGTITDIYSLLRLLYSRAAKPFVGYSNAFSFNDPAGMCPQCEGIGTTMTLDLAKFIDRSKSLQGGALRHPQFAVGAWYWKLYANSGHFDVDKPLEDYSDDEWHMLLYGTEGKIALPSQAGPVNSKYEGLVDKFNRLYIKKGPDEMTESGRATFLRFVSLAECSLCHGARLNKAALSAELLGYTIAELAAMQASDLLDVIARVKEVSVRPVVASLVDRLTHLVEIGLGYLSLGRETTTLSGGESQRIKMVRHLSSSLIEVMYIFDEPSVGLHARDVERLTTLLTQLRDKGNSVFVVEHDPDVIQSADHVIDLGPKAGEGGGEIVYEGTVEGLVESGTLTGRYLRRKVPLKADPREPRGTLPIRGADLHNLKDVSVDVPVGVLTVVTGVAGSGKSTLINDVFLAQHPTAVAITQAALTTNRRSNPATYTGIMDDIRQLFARANGVSASLFSFNSKGACPNCQGHGIIYTDLAFLDPMTSLCEVCRGLRFKPEVLEHRLQGASISDVLNMNMREAHDFFTESKIRHILRSILDVGLDYLRLGQPLNTLSGGECQRIKLADELHKTGAIYVLDEPTTGLHMADVGLLLSLLDRLVDNGSSVVVIEHNLDVIKNADWVIDLGPEGGHDGGEVLFAGRPWELVDCKTSITGQYLARSL